MVDQKLVSFIKKMLKEGFSLNAIKSKLEESDWSEREINEAIDIAIPTESKEGLQSQEKITQKSPWEKFKKLIEKKCPYCSYKISDKDTFCPDCGRKLKEKRETQEIKIVINKEGEVKIKEQEEKKPLFKKIFGVADSFVTGFFIFLAIVLLIFFLIKYFDIRPEVTECHYWPGLAEGKGETVPIFPIIFGEDYQISKCRLINLKSLLFLIVIICSSIVIAYYIILEAYKGLKKS